MVGAVLETLMDSIDDFSSAVGLDTNTKNCCSLLALPYRVTTPLD